MTHTLCLKCQQNWLVASVTGVAKIMSTNWGSFKNRFLTQRKREKHESDSPRNPWHTGSKPEFRLAATRTDYSALQRGKVRTGLRDTQTQTSFSRNNFTSRCVCLHNTMQFAGNQPTALAGRRTATAVCGKLVNRPTTHPLPVRPAHVRTTDLARLPS
jgi:hypothetical protein